MQNYTGIILFYTVRYICWNAVKEKKMKSDNTDMDYNNLRGNVKPWYLIGNEQVDNDVMDSFYEHLIGDFRVPTKFNITVWFLHDEILSELNTFKTDYEIDENTYNIMKDSIDNQPNTKWIIEYGF